MATWNGIAATTRAILGVLEDACPRDDFPNRLSFTAVHPAVYGDTKLPADGFTLCLWRVAPSTARRNLPARLAPTGERYKPSLPLDLHYLLTPWGGTVETQQRLLAWGLRALEDTPVLEPAQLNRYLAQPDVFREDEAVELVADPLTVPDYTALWDKLKPQFQTSMTYVARMVLIDSDRAAPDGPPVRERRFDLARGVPR